jgi:hypothetical protein
MAARKEANPVSASSPEGKASEMVRIISRQLMPSFTMMESVIRICPPKLWYDNPSGRPVWKRCLHALESIDYHLTDFAPYLFSSFTKDVSPEFDVPSKDSLSPEEMIRYLDDVRRKSRKAFSALDDSTLLPLW